MKCWWIFFHDWTPWGNVRLQTVRIGLSGQRFEEPMQTRFCRRCHMGQRRKA